MEETPKQIATIIKTLVIKQKYPGDCSSLLEWLDIKINFTGGAIGKYI
jgi:hypothetical protein